MLILLEYDGPGALPHDKAVAITIVRPRCALGRIVKSGRKRAAGGKAGERNPVNGRLGTAGHHHIGVAKRNQPAGIANRVSAGRTGRDHSMIGPLERMGDRYITGGEIDQPARYEERRPPPRAAVAQYQRVSRDPLPPTDPRADQNAARDLVLILTRMPAGVF